MLSQVRKQILYALCFVTLLCSNAKGFSFFLPEFRGGLATFLSMAYILAVNPRILSESGGPCDADDYADSGGIFSTGYEECMEDVKRQMITATALVSIFGTLLMGLGANLPIALSTGMGMVSPNDFVMP